MPDRFQGGRRGLRGAPLFFAGRRGIGPVSYTHLDVYKRQLIFCANRKNMRAHMPEKPMEDIENQQKEVQKEL